jgi:YjbE family integral membrane protein
VEVVSGVLSIVIIDLVLSGDNAVVIGLAAHGLPPRQRRVAIILGGAAAMVLRISLTALATVLLTLPAVRAVGGGLLVWIAFKLLKQEEEQSPEGIKVAVSLLEAILTILLADFIMSLDNVLGVAAAAHGNFGLLVFGLLLSMAILMLGGSLVASLINRLWWLAYLGGGLLAATGAGMALDDPVLEQMDFLPTAGVRLPLVVVVTAATLVLAQHLHHQRPAARRTGEQRQRDDSARAPRI